MFKKYFYKLLHKYLSLYILEGDSVVSVFPTSSLENYHFNNIREVVREPEGRGGGCDVIEFDAINDLSPDFILLNDAVHYEKDIQKLLCRIHKQCRPATRLIITYYSALWKPFIVLASTLGIRDSLPESNWVSPEDIDNLLLLSGFEVVRSENKVLVPFNIPVISNLVKYRNPWPLAKVRVHRLCRMNDSLLQLKLSCPHNEATGVSNESFSQVITNHMALPISLGVCAEVPL